MFEDDLLINLFFVFFITAGLMLIVLGYRWDLTSDPPASTPRGYPASLH
jgi:hypothetical protein